jgi:hypothetical protein
LKRMPVFFIPVALLLFILFFVGGPDYYADRSHRYLWDQGHVIFFAVLTYLVLSLWESLSSKPFFRQCIWVVVMTLCLGIAIEIAQSGSSRTTSTGDMARNLVGSLFTLFFWAPSRKTISIAWLRTMQTLTVLFFLIGLAPLAIALTDEWAADRQFPVLSDFERPFEIRRWSGDDELEIDHAISYHGKSSLKVQLNTSRYSGVHLRYFPRDWHGYRMLSFGVYNPSSEAMNITCRVHDEQHIDGEQIHRDRFNRTYSLSAGWNAINIELQDVAEAPENRKMDMGHIMGLGIFAVQLKQPKLVYIDYVRLVK